jgi:hypothetical protein
MSWFVEPELDEILSDPMIRRVMERDQVNPDRLRAFLQDMGHTLARKPRHEPEVERRLHRL